MFILISSAPSRPYFQALICLHSLGALSAPTGDSPVHKLHLHFLHQTGSITPDPTLSSSTHPLNWGVAALFSALCYPVWASRIPCLLEGSLSMHCWPLHFLSPWMLKTKFLIFPELQLSYFSSPGSLRLYVTPNLVFSFLLFFFLRI